jgi:CRP-like cAMP-binding protein
MKAVKLSVLGYTLTFGRDGQTEDQGPAGKPGANRPGWAGIPDRLSKSWARTPPKPEYPRQQFSAGSFWHALDPGEKRDFTAVAQRRTFASGATLMYEGDPADHVLVVLSGRTKICVREDGRELLIAERGPGELIGERAALRLSVRSATVVALGMVEALVVTTPLFAEFISAHPRVLSLVEGQVYARRLNLNGETCTVVLTDIAEFGGLYRTEEDRQFVRRALFEMSQAFLDGFGALCSCEDRGDGFLLIVLPGIPTARVVEHLLRELPPRLLRYNHRYSAALQIRLRVAVSVGPVVSDLMGVSGDAIISAARLVEAPVLKESMLARRPNLGLITSEFVYDMAIRPAIGDRRPAGYEQVQVTLKEASFAARMTLIDPDPDPDPDPPAPCGPETAAG